MILSKHDHITREESHVDQFIDAWYGVAERMLSSLLANPAAGCEAVRAAGLKAAHIPFDNLRMLLEIILAAVDRGVRPTTGLIVAVGVELGEDIEVRNVRHLWNLECCGAGLKNYIAILIDYQRRAVLAETLRHAYGTLLDRFAPSDETVTELKTAITDWQSGGTFIGKPPRLSRPAPIIIRPGQSSTPKKTSRRIRGVA